MSGVYEVRIYHGIETLVSVVEAEHAVSALLNVVTRGYPSGSPTRLTVTCFPVDGNGQRREPAAQDGRRRDCPHGHCDVCDAWWISHTPEPCPRCAGAAPGPTDLTCTECRAADAGITADGEEVEP